MCHNKMGMPYKLIQCVYRFFFHNYRMLAVSLSVPRTVNKIEVLDLLGPIIQQTTPPSPPPPGATTHCGFVFCSPLMGL